MVAQGDEVVQVLPAACRVSLKACSWAGDVLEKNVRQACSPVRGSDPVQVLSNSDIAAAGVCDAGVCGALRGLLGPGACPDEDISAVPQQRQQQLLQQACMQAVRFVILLPLPSHGGLVKESHQSHIFIYECCMEQDSIGVCR